MMPVPSQEAEPEEVVAAPKAKKVIPEDDYRKLRKWTTPKLEAFLLDHVAASIRTTIKSKASGELKATELVLYLKAIEDEAPPKVASAPKAKDPDAPKKKRGRPSKAELAARETNGTVTPHPEPDTAIAAAKTGALLPPKKPAGFVIPKLRLG
jgi:hypothetical protein